MSVALLACAILLSIQLLFHQQFPLVNAQQDLTYAHRAVIENFLRESTLPEELKNRFYKNPRVADALAKESWFTSKEMPVFERDAEKIPREQIYKLFRDAGFLKNRR